MTSSETREDMARVFSGDLDNLPALESTTIKMFLSSTFTGK